MAFYKDGTHLRQMFHPEFFKTYPPGAVTSCEGIYRCQGCGKEAISTSIQPLPPRNHHAHTPGQGEVCWRLYVADDSIP